MSVSVRHNERAGARGDGREAPKPAARLPREQDGALDRDELAQIQYIGLSRQALGAACADPAASVTWNGLPVLNLPLQFPETQIVSVPGFQYTSDPSLRTVNIQAPYPLGQPAQTPYYLGRLGGAQPNQPFGGLQAIGANGQ
ncbi:MAG: hypothetical protein M5U26_18220 [Planctomycetota bacterium]|nr:hypothetical protein [Planctomycetota bacterium]